MKTATNVEMQGIEFQIVNDSAEASRGLDELAKSLANLKTSLGTGGSAMSRLAKNITNIKTAVSGLNTSKITELGNALSAFGNATASLSISSSIGNQVQKIANAVTAIPDSTSQKLNDLATSLKPLTELGKQQIGPFITQLKKIPELVTELETVDMSKFKQQMEDLANAMKPFADEMQKVSSGFSAFPSRIQRLITSTERYNGTVKKATANTGQWKTSLKALVSKLTGVTSKTNLFSSALRAISGVAIFRKVSSGLASAIHSASEYVEVMNTFKVSLGEYAQEAYDYAQKVGDVLGIDPAEFMGEQGVLNSIITGFGVAGDKASVMSRNLTQLGYDLQSLYGEKLGTDMSEMFQKVEAGIAGELEPLNLAA